MGINKPDLVNFWHQASNILRRADHASASTRCITSLFRSRRHIHTQPRDPTSDMVSMSVQTLEGNEIARVRPTESRKAHVKCETNVSDDAVKAGTGAVVGEDWHTMKNLAASPAALSNYLPKLHDVERKRFHNLCKRISRSDSILEKKS